ncbi:MAG: flagellar protein FlgN [Pseudomonadota bacterium]|nr:flagellar protein FlgN [Gammaproteobacteria bacterium]MBU1730949.1 flagellar protein FlgN [Gammaproteobacteria bacterium]MBU1893609.1 flagellar protein FlgN [Gammaproteobacteria bacterium]
MDQNSDAAFAALIKAEFGGFQEFHLLLQQEQGALIKGEADQLLRLAALKSELIEKLAGLSAQRSLYISAAGCENNSSGVAAYLDSIKAQTETRELWSKLLDLARDVDQINSTNGILIDTHLRHNQQTLSVLQSAANPSSSLYGPNGQISGSASGRRLDKA